MPRELLGLILGRIQVASGALRMDSSSGGVYSLNEAILCLNLTGSNNIELRFDHRDSSDEYHAMPTGTWTGHANGGEVAISDDGGTTWYTIASLGRNTNWTTYIISLDEMIAAVGMDFVGDFLIKFQQCDNCAWRIDGRGFDSVSMS